MISPDEERTEIRVLAAVDAAFAEARRLDGAGLACHAGCDECCRRPFAITLQDARRLRQGFALALPSVQADIAERARHARQRLAGDFPGDLDTGTLTESAEWREWFFSRHTGLPCPVLDLANGQCRLYAHRPVACRLAGPLIQIGATRTDPCHLCYPNSTPSVVRVEMPEFEQASPDGETIIALLDFRL
ncbi:MAG: YkgJ family cysteine cluster protein [Bryobacteraceae bacterium]|nr:YkgJ family cysteine cluster protein [Bryobacteraceae bacterium]